MNIEQIISSIKVALHNENYQEAERQAIESLDMRLDLQQKGEVLLYYGESLWRLGKSMQAISHIDEAISIFEASGEEVLYASALRNKGVICSHLGEHKEAAQYFQIALDYFKKTAERKQMAISLGGLGLAYKAMSDFSSSLRYFKQALELAEELNDKKMLGSTLLNIGSIYRNLGNLERALQYSLQALQILEEIGLKHGLAAAVVNVASIYMQKKDYANAIEYFEKGLDINTKMGFQNFLVITLGNLGRLQSTLGEHETALKYYRQALTISRDIADKVEETRLLYHLGCLYATSDFEGRDAEIALQYLTEALENAEQLHIKNLQAEANEQLARLYAGEEQWERAYHHHLQYHLLDKEVQNAEIKLQTEQFAYDRQIAVMEKEREVTDMLLHKFLPSPIVNEVKSKEGKILVEKYDSLSVLFADLVAFSKLSLLIEPEVLIELFNYIFTTFDTIIQESGGHRIRTIGDGYFAVCGAPDRVEQHQYKLAKAALRFLNEIDIPEEINRHLPEGTEFSIRVGLHCGEAICGMVGGLEKWQYDIYGDTVNTASRMESYGAAGKIHISEAYKEALASYPEFRFVPREPMEIKGKGMMNTFFLE